MLGVCIVGSGDSLQRDVKKIQETLKEDSIPLIGRLGWTSSTSLIASFVVMGILGSAIAPSLARADEY
jgi:hypothetical protein